MFQSCQEVAEMRERSLLEKTPANSSMNHEATPSVDESCHLYSRDHLDQICTLHLPCIIQSRLRVSVVAFRVLVVV